MKRLIVLSIFLVGSLAAGAAMACGAPFGAGVDPDPHQDIIVVHRNGVETYVFQPSFCGVAKDFGLVMPIPSKLTAIPTLENQAAFARADAMSKPTVQNRTLCRSKGPVDASIGAPGGWNDSGTAVVSSGQVGFLDYAELKADSESALTDWLTANGYPYDDMALSTFSYYVEKGWYVLVFKISRGAGRDGYACYTLGPVRLSFASDVPVVPSRMAATRRPVQSSSMPYGVGFSWRIFAISPGATQVGFDANQSGFTLGQAPIRNFGFSGLVSGADAADLAGLADEGDRLTKLTLTFSYGSGGPDVALALQAAKDYREIQYNDTYVDCSGPDAGSVDAEPRHDALADSDAGVESSDAKLSPQPRDAGVAEDTRPAPVPTGADAGVPVTKTSSHGCAFVSTPSERASWIFALGAGLALLGRVRRRR
jgi:hypothetical protein